MSTTVAGNRCAYCGTWLSATEAHWCEKMHPNWSPSWSAVPDPRVTDALERLARHLVELTEIVHEIAQKLDAAEQNTGSEPK